MDVAPIHRKPEVVAVNRLPAHGLPLPADALSLDGSWTFDFWTASAPAASSQPDGEGPTIDVPGSWMLQRTGEWGIPIYTNVIYPFDIDGYPDIPLEDEGGDYIRSIDIPADWSGDRIVLRVGAAESAMEVFVDGTWVGFSTDSRLPAEFDLTDHLEAGQSSTLMLRVHRWSASTWLEDQDMWWMAGIHRSVHLLRRPAVHLADVFFETLTIPTGNDDIAHVAANVEIGGYDASAVPVRVALVDAAGAVVCSETAMANEALVRVDLAVPEAQLWTAETPHLYELRVELGDVDQVLDETTLPVGVRTVETRQGQLLINGRAITVRGVNRHEHDGVTGRWQSDELLEADIELLKASNVNAVRTAHYPNDERFYQLCDKYGLYVMDEANIETHGLVFLPDKLPANDERFGDAFVARGARMVLRDRNYPSVISWSLGNESGFGPNHRTMAQAMRALDPTRPIAYHPAETDPVVDIIGPMYPSRSELTRLAASSDDRPVIMCEYSHAMGNSNGGLDEYWDDIEASPRSWGGFIWDWVDQGIEQTTADGTHWWAYGGDFGDQPNDRNFNCNGVVDADRRPHPGLRHLAWIYRPIVTTGVDLERGVVRVWNRQTFVDTAELGLSWTLSINGGVVDTGSTALTVDADSTGEATLPIGQLTVGATDQDEVRLLVEWVEQTGKQRVVSWDDLAVPVSRPAPPLLEHAGAPASVTVGSATSGTDHASSAFTLTSQETEVIVRSDGVPTGFRFGDDYVPVFWGQLGLWRPPTDNDDATFGDEMLVSRLKKAGLDNAQPELIGDWVIDQADSTSRGTGTVCASAKFAFTDRLTISLSWLIGPDGDIAFDLRATSDLDLPPLLRLGFEFELDHTLNELEWFGPGPEESYRDRHRGLVVARHKTTADESLFPYAKPQETGNRTDVRWLALTNETGAGLVAVGDPRFDGCALRPRQDAIAAARHPHEIAPGEGTVLRLDAAHAGLGTASCGPGLDAGHDVRPPHIRNRIILRGLEAGVDPGTVARQTSTLARHRQWHY